MLPYRQDHRIDDFQYQRLQKQRPHNPKIWKTDSRARRVSEPKFYFRLPDVCARVGRMRFEPARETQFWGGHRRVAGVAGWSAQCECKRRSALDAVARTQRWRVVRVCDCAWRARRRRVSRHHQTLRTGLRNRRSAPHRNE
jgi:hypothetical protein